MLLGIDDMDGLIDEGEGQPKPPPEFAPAEGPSSPPSSAQNDTLCLCGTLA